MIYYIMCIRVKTAYAKVWLLLIIERESGRESYFEIDIKCVFNMLAYR